MSIAELCFSNMGFIVLRSTLCVSKNLINFLVWASLTSNFSNLSLEAKPREYPFFVSLISALSCLNSKRNSALEVNIL